MKKLATAIFSLALIMFASSSFAANSVRISQVYGGGGGSTGTYLQDYVELFNASGAAVDISGWALEYGSATGNWGSSAGNIFNFPQGTSIAPCSYLLIELGATGTAGVALPVTPDFSTSNLSMSQSNGKVALFNATNANLACGSELPGTLIDKVAYGSANCAEGTAAAGLSSTEVLVRAMAGLTDTDDNSVDMVKFATGAQPLHNAASGPNTLCLSTPASPTTWGAIKGIYR